MLAPAKKAFWKAYVAAYRATNNFYHACKPIIETNGDKYPLIMVLGSPRSGTTWTGNVIATMLKARQVNEPFNHTSFRHVHFDADDRLRELVYDGRYHTYIRPDSPRGSDMNRIEAVLMDRRRNSWRDQTCRPGFYRGRLVKETRANLFMAYLAHNRPDIKMIWIVRNPIKVIESQVAMGELQWRYDLDVDHIKGQPELLEDWIGPFLPEMEAAKSLVERLSHKWCIETFVPLKQNIGDYPNVLMVHYNKLTKGPEEWDSVETFLQCKTWDVDRLRDVLAMPSKSSRTGKAAKRSNYLSDRDIARITKIVKTYRLGMYIS